MNKIITLITGAIVTITLSVFLILNKIDLTTFGTLTTAILGVIYGWYQKIENIELLETNMTLEDNQSSYKYTIEKLTEDNKQLSTTISSLRRDLQISDEKLNLKEVLVNSPEVVKSFKKTSTRKPKVK